jgi:hypothetical protein
MTAAPRIGLIHATALAVEPIAEAFSRHWPQARLMNLLDDSLSVDRAEAGTLTAAMVQRFVDLAGYAKRAGCDAILFTCSAFGPAIEEAGRAVGLPTLKPNEAMFEQALARDLPGLHRIDVGGTAADGEGARPAACAADCVRSRRDAGPGGWTRRRASQQGRCSGA